ncbi:DUF2087 domain-containing protein [Peribacillus glennii]|uniref:DUF2087 domain-containing protein n=1 Tax=Peribacillus glennii TaxID=2303991 RepID=UPI00389A5F2D
MAFSVFPRSFSLDGTNGLLVKFPLKEKQRLIILFEVAKRLESGRIYNGKELNHEANNG